MERREEEWRGRVQTGEKNKDERRWRAPRAQWLLMTWQEEQRRREEDKEGQVCMKLDMSLYANKSRWYWCFINYWISWRWSINSRLASKLFFIHFNATFMLFCCLLLFTKCFSLWQYIKVVKIEKWHKKLVGHYQAQIIQTLIWAV